MDKPVSVQIEEARKNIAGCINAQNMNVTILDMIIKDLYMEIHSLAQQQYEKDKQAHEADIKDDQRAEVHGDSVNGNCE